MDAFEQLVAEILWYDGYWVQTSVRVRLSREQKYEIGRHSTPDWEIDVVGFRGTTNELIAIECKSYFDSTGVTLAELKECEGVTKGRYKLFCEPILRRVVLSQLREQFVADGLCPPGPPATLGMIAGKIKKADDEAIQSLFDHSGWILLQISEQSYRNHVAAVVAKILLRKA